MKICPFCKGNAPDDALKCQHCGEWLDGRSSTARSELGMAARRFVNVWIAVTILSVLFVAWLMWFFIVPNMMAVRHEFYH